jgi:hypothetical protein
MLTSNFSQLKACVESKYKVYEIKLVINDNDISYYTENLDIVAGYIIKGFK